jgi:hypothetical protein
MRNAPVALAIVMSACAGDKWDGSLVDSYRGTFEGDFDAAALKHNITGDATLLVDLYRCGSLQCADVLFDGSLSNDNVWLYGPESHTIRGVTIDYPEVWSAFVINDYRVRAEGVFMDNRQVWLDISVEVAPLGFVGLGTILLELVLDDDLIEQVSLLN